MSLLQRVLGLIPKKASREERTFFSELLKAVDQGSVKKTDIDNATSSVYETLNQLGTPVDASGNINVEFPQTPLNFKANGAFNNVILEWDMPTYSGHNFAEIFRADVDDLSVAEANGVWLRSYANIMADSVDSGTTHYYWVRFVNVIGQAGAFNSPNGTEGTTSIPVEQMINELEGRITSSELAQELAEPIAKIPLLETDLSVIELDIITKYNEQQALIGEAKTLAENGSDQLINDVLALSNDFADKYQAMRTTLDDIESYVNAVITTDPETGQITLDALAAYEDQFNLSIANINQDISVLAGKFTLKVWQTDVDAMGNQTLSAVNDEILARSGVCSLTDFTDAASCVANGGTWSLSSLAQEKKTLVALSDTAEVNAKAYSDSQTTVIANDLAAEVQRTDGIATSLGNAQSNITSLQESVTNIEGENYTQQINEAVSRIDDTEEDIATVLTSTYTKAETDEKVAGVLDYVGAGDFDSGEEERLTAEAIMQNALATADEKTERRQTNAVVIRNDEARVTEDEALATSIELLQANLDDASASIITEQITRATEDEVLANQINQLKTSLETEDALLLAGIESEETARVNADLAETQARELAVSEVDTKIDGVELALTAAITQEQETRANNDLAETNLREQAVSQLNTKIDGVETDVTALIDAESTTRATAIAAEASARQTLQTSLSDDIASVQVDASTAITKADNAQTDANTALVKYGVKLDVNGYVTGFAQNNDGTTGSFYIRADEFAIIDPASNTDATALTAQQKEDATPFAVVEGNTYIKNAYIQDLTADNFVAGKIVADEVITYDLSAYIGSFGTITGGSLNINNKFIVDEFGNVTVVDGLIRSGNFIPYSQGFQLNSNAGGGEFSPHIYGATILGSEIFGTVMKGVTIISQNALRLTDAGGDFYTYQDTVINTFASGSNSVPGGSNNFLELPAELSTYKSYNELPNGVDNVDRFYSDTIEVIFDVLFDYGSSSDPNHNVRVGLKDSNGVYLLDEFGDSLLGGLTVNNLLYGGGNSNPSQTATFPNGLTTVMGINGDRKHSIKGRVTFQYGEARHANRQFYPVFYMDRGSGEEPLTITYNIREVNHGFTG